MKLLGRLFERYKQSVNATANNKSFRTLRSNKGMTLIEIMIVLVIVGLIAATIGTQIFKQFKNAKVKQAKLQMSEITKALDVYYADCNAYPSSDEGLQALLKAPAGCKNWGPEAYVKENQLRDPFGAEFIYENDGSTYVIRSLGNDKKEGGSGVDADLSSQDL